MIPAYDQKGAADALAEICNEREASIHSNLQLGKMFEENNTYRAKQDGAIWRLVHKTDDISVDEEVVVSFQGILCKKDIAPYNEKNIPSGKVKYLRQSATLTAFGNPVFNKPIESIAAIFAIFKRAVGDRLSESPVHSTYEDFPAIDVANRYFTPRSGADSKEIQSLTTEVDPNGYLAKAAGATYVHTEENKVYYFEKTDHGRSFQATGPQIFQLGDIVEVQVSFVAIPLRGSKWKISTILRSVSLFEGRFTQEAFVKSLTQKGAPIEKVKPMLKRRVGYMQEEVSMTRAKLEGMKISEHIETNNDKGKESDEEMDRRDETTPAQ